MGNAVAATYLYRAKLRGSKPKAEECKPDYGKISTRGRANWRVPKNASGVAILTTHRSSVFYCILSSGNRGVDVRPLECHAVSAARLVIRQKVATTYIRSFDRKLKLARRAATAESQGILHSGASELIPSSGQGTPKKTRTASYASSAGNGATYKKPASELTPVSTPISKRNENPGPTAGKPGTSKPSAGSCIPKSPHRGLATTMNGAGTVRSQGIGLKSVGSCSRGWISRGSRD